MRVDWYSQVLAAPSIEIDKVNYVLDQSETIKNNLYQFYPNLVYVDTLSFFQNYYEE